MKAYLVTVKALADNLPALIILDDYEKVQNLITHLDRDTYEIVEITNIQIPVFYEIKDFLVIDDDLEHGNIDAQI
jgi:hypothetical protein